MNAYRKKNFLNGPGKVCKALDLTTAQNRLDLEGNVLFLCDSMEDVGLENPAIGPEHLCTGPRIGVDYAEEARDFPLAVLAGEGDINMYLFDMTAPLLTPTMFGRMWTGNFWPGGPAPTPKPITRAWPTTIFPLAAKFTKEFCHLPDSEESIMAEWMDLAKDAYAHVDGEARRPGIFEAVQSRKPKDGPGDLQRAGPLPAPPWKSWT